MAKGNKHVWSLVPLADCLPEHGMVITWLWSDGIAISLKLILVIRDLRWMGKQIRKFPRKYTQVTKNPLVGRHILHFIG